MTPLSKQQLRTQIRAARQLLDGEEVLARSTQMTDFVTLLLADKDIKLLHSYMASRTQNEPATRPILDYLWQQSPGITIAVPMVCGGQMVPAVVDAQTVWREGTFSIPEPLEPRILPETTQFDAIIVPLLGFNKQGFRLGYGGGYYDRFLATQSAALTIGLCYEEGLIDFIPEQHDIPLDYIVTERRLRKTR